MYGSVYDVIDFCFMYFGGILIIKFNVGVDCFKMFDNFVYINNFEVNSLLMKYFVG